MPRRATALTAAIVLFALLARPTLAAQDEEDSRTQYPSLLANSYVGAGLGLIGHGFSDRQLEPGFHAASVETPQPAVRIDLFGHQLTPYLSVQASYVRPIRYVRYLNVNGLPGVRQVPQAFGGVTLRAGRAVTRRVSVWGEGGLGVTSRFGAAIERVDVVRPAHFASTFLGAAIDYRLSDTVDLVGGLTVLPGRADVDQPTTRLVTLGARYWMRPLPAARVAANRRGGVAFPVQAVRLGFTTNGFSYAPNRFFSRVVPVFWSGDVETRRGVTLAYERNLFHTRARFAFDLGASFSTWTSNLQKDRFGTISLYPLLRFVVRRTAVADYYVAYSVAGPSYISRRLIDGRDTGARFTFQDLLGVGAFIGRARQYMIQIGIEHYSNGNMFTSNAAVKIPLTIGVGRTF